MRIRKSALHLAAVISLYKQILIHMEAYLLDEFLKSEN